MQSKRDRVPKTADALRQYTGLGAYCNEARSGEKISRLVPSIH